MILHRQSLPTIPIWKDTWIEDDFTSGAVSSGNIGQCGWSGTGTITIQGGSTILPGFYRFDTGSVQATQARIHMANSGTFPPAFHHTLKFSIRLNTSDANTTFRCGSADAFNGAPPNNGIYFEKLDGDSNWFCVTRASSSETRTDSGIAIQTTSFVTFEYIRSSTGVAFKINGATVAFHTATIPTALLGSYAYIINSAAAAKTFDIDKKRFTMKGLTR